MLRRKISKSKVTGDSVFIVPKDQIHHIEGSFDASGFEARPTDYGAEIIQPEGKSNVSSYTVALYHRDPVACIKISPCWANSGIQETIAGILNDLKAYPYR